MAEALGQDWLPHNNQSTKTPNFNPVGLSVSLTFVNAMPAYLPSPLCATLTAGAIPILLISVTPIIGFSQPSIEMQ